MAIRKREWTNQDGSVGSAWQVGYSDVAGKWRTRQFDRKRDAERFLEETKRAVRQGTHVADRASVTVGDAAERWIDACEIIPLERSTLRQYRNHIDNHIVPAIGFILLTRLTRATVTDFRDGLLKVNSRVQARKIFTSFKAILKDAESRQLIGHNPAASVEIGRDTRQQAADIHTRVFAQPGEIRAIIATAPLPCSRPFLVTAAFTGLRSSELRGLHWSDLDFSRHRMHVRHRADEFNVIGLLKSTAAYRTIPLAPEVESALREWRVACPRQAGLHVLVFPTETGQVESHTNLLRAFHRVQVKADIVTPRLGEDGNPVVNKGRPVVIAKYGLHDLRHFFHVEHDNPRRSSLVHLVNPVAGEIGERGEVLGPAEPLRLEAAHLAGRGGKVKATSSGGNATCPSC
jgi:integrase